MPQPPAREEPPPAPKFQYGTAGFRMNADLLGPVVYCVGLLAALRSKRHNGQTIGVMITASHNPPADNGVKLVDPMGEMLEASWESHATELANAPDEKAVWEIYNNLVEDYGLNLSKTTASVVFARDTRASGPALVAALVDGLKAAGAEYKDYGFLTTPQLHYMVRCMNTKGSKSEYGEPTEVGYYEKLSDAFKRAMKHQKIKGSVTVDCANGVGAPKLKELCKYLPNGSEGGIDIKIVNDDISRPDMLNVQCGADYVKTQQRAPPSSKAAQMDRCASLDGDADRLMYYFIDTDNQFRMLDGDRIATLAATFIVDLVKHSLLADQIPIGIVQTAYANGASTEYVQRNLNLPVICTPTGVKHLHSAATRFDIGIYFEANGHGTILFSQHAVSVIKAQEPKSPAQLAALETLSAVTDLINQTVGDALSDMLLMEVVLAHKHWSPTEWSLMYKDLPNRLLKVEVTDRNAFKTTDAERRLEEPVGLQKEMDKLIGRFRQGRSFARASGTEDAVRVYAEACTNAEAQDLALKVKQLVEQFGGVYT